MNRVFIAEGGSFAIDLDEIVCVTRHTDQFLCEKCGQERECNVATVYTCGDLTEGFVLRGTVAAELIAAWRAYHEPMTETK